MRETVLFQWIFCVREGIHTVALRILFADDSMTAQNMGKKILTDAGYEVIAVSNGAAALKKINELKPQIVVLDVYMPGYNGLEVCEKLRTSQETAKIPVLLTVGKMEPYKPEDGERVKADGIIVKPFEASDLLAAIEKLSSPRESAAQSSEQPKSAIAAGAQEFDSAEAGQEEAIARPAPSVDVPSDMAAHAAYGFEDLLAPSVPAGGIGSSSAMAAPAAIDKEAEISIVPQADGEEFSTIIASEDTASEFQIDSVSGDSEEAVGPEVQSEAVSSEAVQLSDDLDPPYGAEAVQDEAPMLETNNNGAGSPGAEEIAPDPLVERFDVGGDELAVEKAAGYEATATGPTPDAPIAIEPGFEATSQTANEVNELEAVFLEPSSEASPGPEYSIAFPLAGNQDTESETLQLEESATPAVESEDFEARVNAALSSFESESIEIVPDGVAAESAEMISSPVEHEAGIHEIVLGPDEMDLVEESSPELPAAAAAVLPQERGMAAAVSAAAHDSLAERPANASSGSGSLDPDVISKIVGQVLERSLPEILSQVLTEIEREREK